VLLRDFGVVCTILGHSERRKGFGLMPGEASAVVAAKAHAALHAGLRVLLCIGEEEVDRRAGRTLEVVCQEQLEPVRALLAHDDGMWRNVDLAYEPVWAIGTGLVPSTEQIQETLTGIRAWVSEKVSVQVASVMRIVYGGSVDAKNCDSIMHVPGVDGFLVGGASLRPDFLHIIQSAKHHTERVAV
jgi:triosephosphate isomerase